MANFRCGFLAGVGCTALLMLVACAREGEDEMNWARAALERNHDVEVVAADQHTRTFTVRLKETGELRMVRADQLIASPAPEAAAAAGASETAPRPAPIPTATAANTASPASDAAPTEGTAGAATPENAQSEPRGNAPPATQQASLVPQSAPAAEAAPGKVLESGPGYTIKVASPTPPAASARPSEGAVTSAALERRHEPIVCQGAQLLHIDNRNLVFDGDAVNAEDGCEIHITNSHIRAGGVGILARAANVHIDNSFIEGERGSIDASEGAQVYVTSSHFKGLSRRLDNAALHDLGGNVWN
jgi:hypothetical protein